MWLTWLGSLLDLRTLSKFSLRGEPTLEHSRRVKRSRRGASTAIGALLFLILAFLMIAFMMEVFQLQSNMNQLDLDRIHENVLVTSAYLNSSNNLILNITNRGQSTVNIQHLWVRNNTDNTHYLWSNSSTDNPKFNFPMLNIDPGSSANYTTTQNFTLGQDYSIQVNTARGNSASYHIVPSLRADISIISPSVNASLFMGSNATVILRITNNDTSGNSIYNLNSTLSVNPAHSLTLMSGPSPSMVALLPPGDSAVFSYVYNVTGYGLIPLLNGSYIGSGAFVLNGSFVGAPAGNFNLVNVYAAVVDHVSVTSAYLNSNNNLVLHIVNLGPSTVNIRQLFVRNNTGNTQYLWSNSSADNPNYTFPMLNIDPGSSADYTTTQNFTLGQDYSIQVNTARGNIASYHIVPNVWARVSIYAPSSPQIGQNITVYLGITNNDTSGNNVYNVVPTLSVSPVSSLTPLEGPNPSNITLLPTGETAYFRYVYKVTGSGLEISLKGSFTNAPLGNYDNCTIYATTFDAGQALTTMPIWRLDSVGSIPALLDPSSGVKTYWGVALVNPYDRNITVYSVGAIASSSPIFAGGAGALKGIHPTTGWILRSSSGYAGCFWEAGSGQAITIPARSAYNFTFTVEVQAPAGGVIETPVYIEAITTEGKFSRTFTTSVDTTYPSMNLYYTRNAAAPLTDFQYALLGVKANTEYTFNATVYNSGKNILSSRYNLLILVPVGWTNVTVFTQSGWNFATQLNSTQGDGSTILSVVSSGTSLASGAYTVYQFKVITPAVASTTLYRVATTLYYPDFSPSITAAFCDLAVQIVP